MKYRVNSTRDVIVMPDGRISFPVIGDILSQGRTITELKEIIICKLKNYTTAPEVTVIVNESLSKTVYTIGTVNEPGPLSPVSPNMTVLQALSTAGGFYGMGRYKKYPDCPQRWQKEVQLRFN